MINCDGAKAISRVVAGRRAKKSNLETERPIVRSREPARGVPPLGAKRGMCAAVLRKDDRTICDDVRELGCFGKRRQNGQHANAEQALNLRAQSPGTRSAACRRYQRSARCFMREVQRSLMRRRLRYFAR
jgi:hypothetical protein